jgi:hypothetical protein
LKSGKEAENEETWSYQVLFDFGESWKFLNFGAVLRVGEVNGGLWKCFEILSVLDVFFD